MARLIETREDQSIELYTKDSLTDKVKRVGEFASNGGGLIIGSAGVDGVAGSETDNVKLHRGGSQVLQFVIGSDSTPDGVRAPASFLAKIHGVFYYNYIIGTAAQYANGEATHPSFASLISSGISSGSKILVIGKTEDSSLVTIPTKVLIEGIGSDAEISCDVTLGLNSSKSFIKKIRFLGNLAIESGSNNNIVSDCWIVSTKTVTDNNTNPNNLIVIVKEV